MCTLVKSEKITKFWNCFVHNTLDLLSYLVLPLAVVMKCCIFVISDQEVSVSNSLKLIKMIYGQPKFSEVSFSF